MSGWSKIIVTDEGRICSICKEFKSWNEYSKCASGTRGHKSSCKNCIRKKRKVRKHKKVRVDNLGRECRKCKAYLPWDEFPKRSKGPRGYSCYCEKCTAILEESKRQCGSRIDDFGRECSVCGEYKTWDYFPKARGCFRGYASTCNKCSYLKRIKAKYGITKEEYALLQKEQNYSCAICGELIDESSNLCVDHDHETGKVRGLLCAQCNKGLGHFRDSPKALMNAVRYICTNRD